MEKKGLYKIIDDIFVPLGFKKTGSKWRLGAPVISKEVWLQRSNYGNFYHLNYGYVITSLIPKEGWIPAVNERFGAGCSNEKIQELSKLLDLSNDMHDEVREKELKKAIDDIVIPRLNSICLEQDIISWYKIHSGRPMPLTLKSYFNIST